MNRYLFVGTGTGTVEYADEGVASDVGAGLGSGSGGVGVASSSMVPWLVEGIIGDCFLCE